MIIRQRLGQIEQFPPEIYLSSLYIRTNFPDKFVSLDLLTTICLNEFESDAIH